MINSKEYNDLLDRRDEIMKERDECETSRTEAKKQFAEIDFCADEQRFDQMAQSIYDQGAKGDKQLLNMIATNRSLMHKTEMEIKALAEEIDKYCLNKETKCEEELAEINRQISSLESQQF